MKIIIKTTTPHPVYRNGKQQPIDVKYYMSDGWRLLAESLKDAIREVELMGEKFDGVEVEH